VGTHIVDGKEFAIDVKQTNWPSLVLDQHLLAWGQIRCACNLDEL
jgi:hypothetical protein